MSQRLPLYDGAGPQLDASLVHSRDQRAPVPSPTLAVVAAVGEDVTGFVDAVQDALGEGGYGLCAIRGQGPFGAHDGALLDGLLAQRFREATGPVMLALGPELPARMKPTLLVVVTGGRSVARLSSVTRRLLPFADLVLEEARSGVGAGLGQVLQRAGGDHGVRA